MSIQSLRRGTISAAGGAVVLGYADRVLSYNASGLWVFETDFLDTTENSLDMTGVNTPTIVEEAPSGLNGAAHSVLTEVTGARWLLGTDNDLWTPTAFTIGGWIRQINSSTGVIIAKGFSGGGVEWHLRLLSTGFLRTTIGNTAGAAHLVNTSDASVGIQGDDTWHFVGATYDGVTTLRLYLDGAEVASTTTGPTGTRASNGTQAPAIGAFASAGSIWDGNLYGIFLIPSDIGIAGLDDIFAATTA